MSICIIIDVFNNPEVLEYFRKALSDLGWYVESNTYRNIYWVEYPNKTGRYFSLDLESRYFAWHLHDEEGQGDEEQIKTLEDAAGLIQFVKLNGDLLKPTIVKEPITEFQIHNYQQEILGQFIKDTTPTFPMDYLYSNNNNSSPKFKTEEIIKLKEKVIKKGISITTATQQSKPQKDSAFHAIQKASDLVSPYMHDIVMTYYKKYIVEMMGTPTPQGSTI